MPILISLLFIILSGCQSNQRRLDEFGAIEMGMRKRDVLDVAGNPRFTNRKKDIDRWFYYLVPEEPQSIRVVHFKNNQVIYKGHRQEAQLSVEEIESVNKPRVKPYIRSLSDDELKELIKKDMRKEKKKKPKPRYEDI